MISRGSTTPVIESAPGSRRGEILLLGAICLLGFLLRVYHLGAQSVWIDEAYALRLADLPPSGILYETSIENHPPLYFLLLSAWVRLGPPGEWWARFFSVVLGTGLIAALYGLGKELGDRRLALVGAALLAVSPVAVWHSQDARMYPLVLLSSIIAFTRFLRFLRVGGWGNWALFVGGAVAALYSHLYAVSLLALATVVALLAGGDAPPKRRGMALLGVAVAGLAWAPWAVVVMSVPHHAGFYKPITALTIPYVFYVFSVGYTFGPPVAVLRRAVGFQEYPWQYAPIVLAAAVIFAVPFLAGLKEILTRCRGGLRVLGLMLVVPLLIPVAITLTFGRIDFNVRYAFLVLPAYLLVLATGLISLKGPWRRVVTGLILVVTFGSLFAHYFRDRYAKEDVRSAYHLIQAKQAPGDCVAIVGVAAAYDYYDRQHGPNVMLDLRSEERIRQSEATLEGLGQRCGRLWFIYARPWEDDPAGAGKRMVEKHFGLVTAYSFPGVEVGLYGRVPPAGAVQGG